MLYRWGKKNLETLSCERAQRFLVDEVIPHCLEKCNAELALYEEEPLTQLEFMAMVGLKTLCVKTAWNWLRMLGFEYCENTKTYYTDGHERPDNVADRMRFIPQYFEIEKLSYRWAQIPEKDAIALENEGFLKADEKLYERYENENGEAMREYHIDCNHKKLLDYVPDEYKKFGAAHLMTLI